MELEEMEKRPEDSDEILDKILDGLGSLELRWRVLGLSERTTTHPSHHAAAIIGFSQTFLAMLLRLVGTADTAGVCEKEP